MFEGVELVTRKSKYRAVAVKVDGVRFASKAEAKRYAELRLLERSGEISHLELQPRFDLTVNGQSLGFYKADFRFFTRPTNTKRGEFVVEDVKGVKTPLYVLKRKLTEALYPGVKIVEVAS